MKARPLHGSARLLALAALIAFSGRSRAADPAPLFDVPRMDGIEIDGKPDDWGERGFRVEMIQDRSGEHKQPDDVDARFRLGWDKRGLLLLLFARDDIHIESDDVWSLYENDSVELFAAAKRGADDLYQVQVGPGMDARHGELRHALSDLRNNPELRKQPLVFVARLARDGDSYALEALLPWENLGINPKDGEELAFQLVVNDNDGDGRIARLQWFPGSGTVSDSSVSHRIRLAKEPGPPVLAAALLSYEGTDKMRVFIAADETLDGTEVGIVGGDGVRLAAVSLKAKGGRARGEAILPYPLPESAGKHLLMLADGKQVGTIDQQLMPPPAQAEGQKDFGRGIARTMSLLATSSPEKRNRVKILFYGHHIIVGEWWKILTASLRNRYPDADLVVHNLTVSPYGSPPRMAVHKVYPMYPDLVILQMSSGSEPGGEMEQLVADIRRRTTAEIMLCSHLLTNWKAGQGDDAKTDDHKERDKSSAEIAELAKKYDCEFVDICGEWRRYMDDNNLNSEELMYGGQNNLNTRGNAIMEMIFARHFQYNSGFPVRLANAVITQPVTPEKDGSIRLEFHGNRIDVLPGAVQAGDKRGSARILIDGKPPSENSRLYAISVPGKPPVGFWPAIKRVSHEKPLVIEDWTLRLTNATESGGEFEFEVVGSVTGPDGSGNNKEKFVSKSGRAIIEPGDWAMLGNLGAILKEGRKIEISWSVLPQFLDVYTAPDIKDPALDHAATLAQGLENGKHSLEIIPNGDGAVPIKAARVYRPPLE